MSFRFRKRVKIVPGVRVNLSKSGASLSVGRRGATVNVGKKGVRTTVGIPGSGMSWSKHHGWSDTKSTPKREEISSLADFASVETKTIIKIADKGNASIARANKAMETLNGGRGATEAKKETFRKRMLSEAQKNQELRADLFEKMEFFCAVEQRLEGMRFGIFGGGSRKLRDQALGIVNEAKLAAESALRDLDEVATKLADALLKVSKDI